MTSHPSLLLDSKEESEKNADAALDLALSAPPPTAKNDGSPKRPQPCSSSSSDNTASLDTAPLKKAHTEDPISTSIQQPLGGHVDAETGMTKQMSAVGVGQGACPTKIIFIRDLAGIVSKTRFRNKVEFDVVMKSLGGHLEDDQGIRIFAIEQLVDHATYYVVAPSRDERLPFDFGTLVRPDKIPLPLIKTKNEFVSENGWIENVLSDIDEYFNTSDERSEVRIPPLALVRCSRGGKTRCLLEIAHALKRRDQGLAVLFVSFNDFSPLVHDEQQDPLQALLRRIVFQATKEYSTDSSKEEAFDIFREQEAIFNPSQFRTWLGQTPAILLVDELNNLIELTQPNSASASDFGKFVKSNFISKASRYMVFSSHIIGTLGDLTNFVDPSKGSKRRVILQALPRISGLSMAKKIDHKLESVRQALRCGFIPGLIYDQRPSGGKEAGGKRQEAVENYNKLASNHPEQVLMSLLRSFITGDIKLIPAPLHILFDTVQVDETGSTLLRWIPLHFEYVMSRVALPFDSQLQVVANKLVELCQLLFIAKDKSGDGWEAAFVIVLLLRCAAHFPDNYFLPANWFRGSPAIEYNNYESELSECSDGSTVLSDCTCWSNLQRGIQVGRRPTIVVQFPNNARFERYDAFVLLYKDGILTDSRGFQLKEGKNNPSKSPLPDIGCSFVIKGCAPVKADNKPGEWRFASKQEISNFFGVSGERWTPAYLESFKKN